MGLLDSVTGLAGKVQKGIKQHNANVKKAATRKEKEEERRENEMIAKQDKYLPVIQKVAREFKAHVEPLDTAAFVYKMDGNRQHGTHISYGMNPAAIRTKLKVTFTKSATASKITHGIHSAIHAVKTTKKEIDKASKELKGLGGKGGNMYENPSFGAGIVGGGSSGGTPRRKSTGTKKRKTSSSSSTSKKVSGNGLYPDLDFGM